MTAETMIKIMQEARTIAVVGLSKKPHRAGYYVPEYLQQAGFRIIPVNPYLHEPVLSEIPYPDLDSVPEKFDLVLLFQRSENVPPFVDDAIRLGARSIWMQLGIANEASAEKARQAGLDVVQDACIMIEHRRLM